MSGFSYGDNKYKAEVVRWLDGDTVTLRVDLGQKVMVEGNYRLNRINAPETHLMPGVTEEQKTAGLAVKARLEAKCPTGTVIWVGTAKADKYGRYLAEIWYTEKGGWLNLNDWLLTEGLVKAYDGTGPKPV